MSQFFPVSQVVKAAVTSTEKYLAYLTEFKRGVEKHRATHISVAMHETCLFENRVCSRHQCKLPRHQSIPPDSAAILIPHSSPAEEIQIHIEEYDRKSGDTTFLAKKPVEDRDGDVVIDFRWLVERCLDWLKNNGNRLCSITEIPASPHRPLTLEDGVDGRMSPEQLKALSVALSSPLSYIWGPPGTGKTRFILAPTARLCVNQDERVLVVASTNLAVDNALSAIIDKGVDRKTVARIGVPSPGFIEKFPDCCEQRAFEREIRQIGSEINSIEQQKEAIKKARQLDGQVHDLLAELDERRSLLEKDRTDLVEVEAQLSSKARLVADRTLAFEALERHYRDLSRALLDLQTLECEQIQCIRRCDDFQQQVARLGIFARLFTGRKSRLVQCIVTERQHLHAIESTLRSRHDCQKDLPAEVGRIEEEQSVVRTELDRLRDEVAVFQVERQDLLTSISSNEESLRRAEVGLGNVTEERSRVRIGEVGGQYEDRLVALQENLDVLHARLHSLEQDLDHKRVLGMTLDGFIGLTLDTGFTIDRVLLDEAPYAPLAKVLPLLSLRRPVAMFGDHFQLPPVCENDNDSACRSFWAKPGIFLESAFGCGTDLDGLDALEQPTFHFTRRSDLKVSYRFAPRLARLLDRYVYGECGFAGLPGSSTGIECISCDTDEFPGRKPRQNRGELSEICAYVRRHIDKWRCENARVVVLAPYRNQVELIRQHLGSSVADVVEVLNTHRTQGREWDWVLFSVCDTAALKGNVPYFTDSNCPIGNMVLNTTISRAKKHLAVFLDVPYWRKRKPESLLTAIARNALEES